MLERSQLLSWLEETDVQKVAGLLAEACRVKESHVGRTVYLRGLVEISNICRKNCLYCGLRSANPHVERYELGDDEILEAARFASAAHYGSIVIQGGERKDRAFRTRVTRLLRTLKDLSRERPLGITLSLGEQPCEVYQEWFEAGAHRYLLRIETSDPGLYFHIHPNDGLHRYDARLRALYDLKRTGYQVGTGVMIGLPGQTVSQLADDLLFFHRLDLDMCGMGPYLVQGDTPLARFRGSLWPAARRLDLSLRMVALLRLLMPDINIAATTALQVIDVQGREKAIMAGANVVMPNITSPSVRGSYLIYDSKPGLDEDAELSGSRLEACLDKAKIPIGWDRWGDSIHFLEKSR